MLLILIYLRRCLSNLAGVKRPPLESGNKILRPDDAPVSRARSVLCVCVFSHVKIIIIIIPYSLLCSDDRMQFSSSQPDFAAGGCEVLVPISETKGQVSFSQPIKPEHMLLATQLLCTPGASQVKPRAASTCYLIVNEQQNRFISLFLYHFSKQSYRIRGSRSCHTLQWSTNALMP